MPPELSLVGELSSLARPSMTVAFMWRVPGAALLDAWIYSLSKRNAASTATGALRGEATLSLNARSRTSALPDGVDFWNAARMQRSRARVKSVAVSPKQPRDQPPRQLLLHSDMSGALSGTPGRSWRTAWIAPLWRDVLVYVEEIVGIVGAFDLNQAIVVLAVVVSNSAVIVVLHEVDVAAGLRVGGQRVVVVA